MRSDPPRFLRCELTSAAPIGSLFTSVLCKWETEPAVLRPSRIPSPPLSLRPLHFSSLLALRVHSRACLWRKRNGKPRRILSESYLVTSSSLFSLISLRFVRTFSPRHFPSLLTSPSSLGTASIPLSLCSRYDNDKPYSLSPELSFRFTSAQVLHKSFLDPCLHV